MKKIVRKKSMRRVRCDLKRKMCQNCRKVSKFCTTICDKKRHNSAKRLEIVITMILTIENVRRVRSGVTMDT